MRPISRISAQASSESDPTPDQPRCARCRRRSHREDPLIQGCGQTTATFTGSCDESPIRTCVPNRFRPVTVTALALPVDGKLSTVAIAKQSDDARAGQRS